MLNRESRVYKQMFELFISFAKIDVIGVHIDFTFTPNHVEVDIHVNSRVVASEFVLTQLTSGKMSRKALPIFNFNGLYQDSICDCLLRLASEVQEPLPVAQALAKQLNPATGHIKQQVIAWAAMPRETPESIRFEGLNLSDTMRNFVCVI